MIEITKWPVIVYANYRTGSTALVNWLGEKYNCPCFSDPFYRQEVMDDFLSHYYSDNKRYIIKFMADHILEDKIYNDLLKMDAYKIRMYRNNKVDQITSYYISLMTERWMVTKSDVESMSDYGIPIDKDNIRESVRRITFNDHLLSTIDVNFDQTFIYEDLGIIETNLVTLTKQPNNLGVLKKVIGNLAESQFANALYTPK